MSPLAFLGSWRRVTVGAAVNGCTVVACYPVDADDEARNHDDAPLYWVVVDAR